MYRIFKNDCSIILTSKRSGLEGTGFQPWSKEVLADFLSKAEKSGKEDLVFYSTDLDGLWREFKGAFEIIEAAGGMVRNLEGMVLFIYRNGKWDLPKGKIDPGETVKAAALREVKEECGFESLELVGSLPTTYHLYRERDKEILKVTHWFGMCSDDTDLSPQTEEGISELRWTGRDDLQSVLSNTYPNIALLVVDQMVDREF